MIKGKALFKYMIKVTVQSTGHANNTYVFKKNPACLKPIKHFSHIQGDRNFWT